MNEQYLLVDSTYDAHAMAETLDALPKDPSTLSEFANYGWAGAEYAGSRKTRIRETLHGLNSSASVLWLAPSCLTHTVLLPSLELESIRCSEGKFEKEDYTVVCRNDAVGVRSAAETGIRAEFTLWLSTFTWTFAGVADTSVQTWVGHFLSSNNQMESGMLLDECHGPNCLSEGSQAPHQCQALFEPTDNFVPAPIGFQILVIAILTLFVATFLLRFAFKKMTGETKVEEVEDDSPEQGRQFSALIQGLTVTNTKGECLVEDVSLAFRPGTVNGVIGRSGCGKTTLLRTLSGQLPRGLTATCLEGSQLHLNSTTLLGQHDSVALDNMPPNVYLRSCAEIYGASVQQLEDILSFARQFFLSKTNAKVGVDAPTTQKVDPFYDTPINKMSGGQRRVLAIAAALLTEPRFLLLDEPLSGLDSVASEKLVLLLTQMAGSSTQGFSALFTVHQPSASILGALDDIVIMDRGKVVICESSESLLDSCKTEDVSIDIRIHQIMEQAYNGEVMQATPQATSETSPLQEHSCASLASAPEEGKSKKQWSLSRKKRSIHLVEEFRQVPALIRRLYQNFGTNWADLIVLPLTFLILALVFRLEDGSPAQVILVSAFFIFLPVIIFQHHLLFAKDCWMAHRLELDDRRITCSAYMMASLSFSMTVPVVSVVLSHVVGYAALGYSYQETFVVQTVFACLYLMVIVVFGRSLCLLFWGRYIYWKLYLICIFFNILFGGLVNSLHSVPEQMLWLYSVSYTYWAVSGAVLNQFQFNGGIGESPCSTFAACVLYDGNVMASASGFGILSSTYLSMGILLLALVAEVILECLLLRSRRARHCPPGIHR